MNSTIILPDDPRERRKALKRVPPRDEPCGVPGCRHGRVTDDCCYEHSLTGPGPAGSILPNDGIIDWTAVDVAARGLRKVRLTWVERDIAVGMIFARGGGPHEAQERTGARVLGAANSRRVQAALRIAHVLNGTSNHEGPDA